jgi:hypothetical protein
MVYFPNPKKQGAAMVERICPACRYGNTIDAHYCSKCGAALERLVLARDTPTTAITVVGRLLPVHWRKIGTTVAVGAAALAAEAGIAWLRRRIADGAAPPAALARRPTSVQPTAQEAPQRAQSVTTIISQRIVEVTETRDGTRTVSDRQVWRKIEE